ncbi:hypothetical protein ACM26V_00465 [Salipaludibacillus sp. HK11]|uniref:hypothetical protein n=1 Tax=Salipaludibacillus sp. HK11 TaxID=3394320 RepID=UPI0039FB8AC0
MELFKMFGRILIDDKEANASLSRTDKNTKTMGDRLRGGIKTAAKFGAALAAGAAVAVGAMVGLGVKIGNTADEILDLNSTTGMSTDAIQAWRKVTEEAGVSTDAVADASFKLTKNLDTMSVEGHKGQEALSALGLSLSEIESMSADERMNVLTEALSGVEDKTERARIGADLFGGSWKELAPVVDLGAEAMDNAKGKANIISENDLKKANDFRIKVENMKERLSFFVTEIAIKVLPILTVLFEWFESQMPKIQAFGENAFNLIELAMGKVSDFVTDHILPVFKNLYGWVQEQLPLIKELFLDAFQTAKGVLADLWEWIEPHIPQIQEFFEEAFNKIIEVTDTLSVILNEKVIPALIELWEWIEPHLPMIEEAFYDAFQLIEESINKAIEVVGWLAEKIEEHWGIVQPIIIAYAALIATRLIVQWTLAGVQALLSAGKQVAAWVMTQGAAIAGVATQVASVAIMVAKWVFMGAQAMAQAARMAAAWLLAMGPVGWVIATIIGLVAIIIANWDTIVGATKWLGNKLSEIWRTTVDWIKGKVNDLLGFFGGLKGKFASRASGMWDGIKNSFKSAINWIIGKWNNFKLKIGGQEVSLPFGQSFSIPSIELGTPNIPMFAKGVRNFAGGAAIVGEQGPELVNLAKGSNVFSNPETNAILGGGGNVETLLMKLIEAVREEKNMQIDGKTFAKVTGDYSAEEGGVRIRRTERGLA